MRIKWLAAPLAMALVLGACGGDDDSGADPAPDDTAADADDDADDADDDAAAADPDADPVTLDFALFGGFGLDDLIERYQTEVAPHVTINVQMADYGDHHDALVTALAAGSGAPDIAAVEVGYIGTFSTQPEAFHNLYDYGAADIQDRYLDWKWEQAQTIDGETVIGIPTDIGGMAVCYRHDLFEEAGVETDREALGEIWGDSWEDFVAFGEEYVAATGRGFMDNQGNAWNAVVNQDPNIYYDADGNEIYEESSHLQYAWDVVTSMIEADLFAETPGWSAEWEAGMSDGSFATLTCPAWMMGYIMDVAPDTEGNWDLATIPEGGGNWGGSHLTVPAQSEHPQEAFDFISWIMAPEQQLEVFIENGNFPSIPELFDHEAIQTFESEFFNGAPAGPIFADNALDVVSQNIGPDYSVIDGRFQDGLTRVIDGLESPDEAWETALEEIRRETS
jgi:cellobiose transport system substrate-binding protein